MKAFIRLKKPLVIIIAVISCFIFAYIKDAKGSVVESEELRTIGVSGIQFVSLHKNSKEIELRFFNQKFENDILNKSNCDLINPLLKIKVPLANSTHQNLKYLNYNDMEIELNYQLKDASQKFEKKCYHDLKLNTAQLLSGQSAFVEGEINLINMKEEIEISGSFRAMICEDIKD